VTTGDAGTMYSEAAQSWFAKATVLFRSYAVTVLILVFAVSFTVSTAGISGTGAYYPRFLLVVVYAVTAFDVVSTVRRTRQSDDSYVPPQRFIDVLKKNQRALLATACLLGYWCAIPFAGFYVSSIVFLFVTFMALHVRLLLAAILTPSLIVVFYLLFNELLGIALPTGMWM